MSTLDQGQDGAIVREDAEAKEQGTGGGGGDGEHGQNPAEQEVGSDKAEEEDEAPAAAPPTSATAANAKSTFGMKRSNPTVKKGNDAYNYEEKYPEDARYEETTSNARVWRTYEDESRIHDANMVEESRDSVDVLLVFAGLFSAVVTTFVAQTYQNLQVDYAAMSASLLYESVLVQRAIANGSPVNSIAPSPLNPTITFVPATTDVWVNGLWFTSLFLSLTTALVAVLVKQWLHHYVALPSGTPRDRSFTRQFRYAGFQKWHVQVVIGLLPVLMHLALAIFLVGLVIFLQPLRKALSWIICAGTILIYTAYAAATILPIIFPQCPYRTPLCDLVYISLCRIVPQVTWYNEEDSEDSEDEDRRWTSPIFRYLPRVQSRTPQSLAMAEFEFVKQTSTNLAAEALDWLFSVSSNPTVQSIVIQSIGSLPMTSEERFRALQPRISIRNEAMDTLRRSLLSSCLQTKGDAVHCLEPVPGMELRLERLLRFYCHYVNPNSYRYSNISSSIDSFDLAVTISFNDMLFERDGVTSVSPGTLLVNSISGPCRLPPRCWFHLVECAILWLGSNPFDPLDPGNDDHANMFPLNLCSAIFRSLHASPKGLTQDFNSPLVLDFKDALPYFLDKISDSVLRMFSKFVEDPPSSESLPQSLRMFAAAIKFLLHKLSLPGSGMSHIIILESLFDAVDYITDDCRQTYPSPETTAVIMVLEDILVHCVILKRDSTITIAGRWHLLYHNTILAYQNYTIISPSACSLRGLRALVHFMTTQRGHYYYPWTPCKVLTDLLAKRISIAFTSFRKNQCLQLYGKPIPHHAFVPMVSEYVAGIYAMQHGSDGAVDTAALRLHIDYLHDPHNLFTACSILAACGTTNRDRSSIKRDITTLVQLHPVPRDAAWDTAWDECRRKLRDIVQGDSEDCLSKHFAPLSFNGTRPLPTDKIEAEKDNIKYAIYVLDDFFDGGAHIVVPSDSSPERRSTSRIHRFLGWRLGRKSDGMPEQGQQV